MTKIEKLQNWLSENGIDIAYVSDFRNVAYFTGYESDPEERVLALFVFPDKDPFLFTPQLEVEAARKAGWKYDIYGYLDHEQPFEIIGKLIKDRQPSAEKWAIEKDELPFGRFEQIKKQFPELEFTYDLSRYIEEAKLIKTDDELQKMIAAGKEADYAFEVGFKAIDTNKTEQDVVAEIEYKLKKKGVMHTSFDTIVQGGRNAANPHGAPEAVKLQKDELILFDLGTVHQGYVSDASRTVAFGKPNDQALDIYKVCLEAQLAAQDAAKPGMTAAELDNVARSIIEKAGYGDYFIHRLGHGIGSSTHEYPSIMEGNNLILQKGMCFSIEPGIYIPGEAGVRIEDSVYLTDTKAEPFTHTSKELKYID